MVNNLEGRVAACETEIKTLKGRLDSAPFDCAMTITCL